MKKLKKDKIINLMATLLLIIGIIFISIGFDKKYNYINNEGYSYLNKNAYVGGDAYNYIINANYFTGYMVLGATACLSSVILYATSTLMPKENKKFIQDVEETQII